MESPNDLRYETLIKIISSASVGCRGAYTTASRECNDLNGNNSVKDGCSRPCKYVGGASMPLPAFRSARIERKKGRGGDTVGRRKQSCTGDIVIWALDSRPRTATITPGTRTLDARGEQEFSRNSRTAERSKCARSGKRGIAGREPVAISPLDLPPHREKKLNAALVPEQNMAHVASRGTIGPVGGEQTEQELHSPPRYYYYYYYSCPLDITP